VILSDRMPLVRETKVFDFQTILAYILQICQTFSR
jgi:hypothetical protein